MNGRLPLLAPLVSRRAKVQAARSFVRLLAVALLTLAFVPSAHAQLPIAPAPDGTVFVRVAGRGFVKRTSPNGDASSLTTWEDPDGRTTWVEYDDLGTVVRWITQERGAVVSC